MATLLEMKDNIPFWLHEEGGAFFPEEGIINVYHCQIAQDGTPTGPRNFLFQVAQGELLLSVAPYSREDGTRCGILAVPMRDSVLSQVDSVFSADMRPLTEKWVEQCCRRLGYTRDQIERACTDLEQTGTEAFGSEFIRLVDRQVQEEALRTVNANRRRYAGEQAYLTGALDTLQSVVPGGNRQGEPASGDYIEDPLIMACAAVARSCGMEITVSNEIREGRLPDSPVESIAAASRFRTREVILSGKWYLQDGGSFLAKLEESGEPVALLQKTPRSYILFNPATGERVKVTKKIAEKVDPKAVMFYRSMPTHSLNGKDVLRFVLQGTRKADWAWVFLMGIGGGLLGMLSPEITGIVFETVIPDGNRNLLVQIGFLMGALSLTTFAFEFTRASAVQRISGAAERDLQSAVWDRLLSLPVGFFKKFTAGELSMRAMSISQIQQVLSSVAVSTIMTGIFSAFYIIVMFRKSTRLAWIGIAISLIALLVSLGFGWLQLKHEGTLLKTNNKISGRMFGWLSGLAKIKMSGSEKRTFYNWSRMFRDSRAITFRKESIGNWAAVFGSSITLISSIILFYAIFNLMDNKISPGAFIAFNAAFGKLMQSCVQLSGAVMSVNVIGPLYKEAKPIFEAVPEYDEQKTEAPPLTGDIELSHINFSYDKDGPQIIKDVSLRIRSGEHIALVGPSGSGKSTLFRILLAFEQPDSGDVYFDGVSLGQLDVRSVRRQLGVVLQTGQLLAGSIFENIAGANPGITQDDAMRAVRQAGMEEDLTQMPMGLHTMVSEGAGTLSGGQRQRLLIARALAGNPKILFFDEATSALDNKTQKIVIDSVNQLKVTRITIAHRL
ncbi:MAG: NHLP bacteriocin export ABC transporter permease/ATPase subunit, partial [Oscillospiraceae bacterium]|nr:NHLP bacteriocin export ABC transporter permease/ATPase subunit [Oscillospiraceae bacterium]